MANKLKVWGKNLLDNPHEKAIACLEAAKHKGVDFCSKTSGLKITSEDKDKLEIRSTLDLNDNFFDEYCKPELSNLGYIPCSEITISGVVEEVLDKASDL